MIGVEDVETDLLSASGTSMFKSHFRYCVIAGRETDTKPNPLLGNENAIGDYPLWLLARQEHMSSVVGAGYSRVLSWYDAKGRGTDFGRHSADADDLQKIKAEIDIKKRAGRRVILLIEPVSDCKIRSGMKLDEDISDELVDSDVHAFANHAANVAAALKNDVDCYELINEPNIWFAGSGAKNHQLLMPPDRYAKYVIEGVKAIRQVYPEARIAANINGIHPDYVEGVLAAGAAPYIDEFTYHAYRGTPETPPICNEISALRKVVDKYKPGLPIENDEQYYGTREDPFGTTLAEYDRDYVSDTEREQTGRLLQTCLHCLSQKSSYCMFWTSASIYEYGDSSPWFLYYTFGGFRFISQMLHDIANTRRIDIDSGVRAFAFERADGTIIVSINSRAFDRPGTILRSKADAAYDLNGNPLPTNATPFSYLPSYLVYNKGKTIDQVTSGIAHAGLTGFAEPVQAAFKVTSGVLHLIVTNASNQPVSAKISFTQMPKGWGTPADFKLDDLGPHASKTFVLANDIPAIKWWMTTNVSYHVSGGSFDYVKTGRIATIYVPKAKIDIASGFQDWVSIKRINLGIYSLSYDFSMGKLLHKDPNELSADVGLAWDENAFYVDVNVKTPVFDPGYFDDMYNHSSVQLYFDLLDHAGPTYDDGCCVYTIGWDSSKQLVAYLDQAPGGRYIGEANKTTGVDGEVKLNWKKTDKGYRIEMAFPKSTLPFLALKPGSDFGFSCLINDNHGQGRMAGITLGPDGTEPYQNPSIWREVELAP
ncbi:MAG: sugar-binding protein [Capsulimonadaceae bacterium]|nr:sugar-binding protein [Capsulimonadaceae bacterium]